MLHVLLDWARTSVVTDVLCSFCVRELCSVSLPKTSQGIHKQCLNKPWTYYFIEMIKNKLKDLFVL